MYEFISFTFHIFNVCSSCLPFYKKTSICAWVSVCVCVCVYQGNDSQLMKKWLRDLIQTCLKLVKQVILDIECEKNMFKVVDLFR